MTPENLIAELKRIGINGQIGSNGWYRALCPYHNESRPSWGIATNIDHHPFSCFSCKVKGNLYRLLVDIGGYSYEKARRLAKVSGAVNTRDIVIENTPIQLWPIDESELYPYEMTRTGENYLKKRGVDLLLVEELGLVYAPKMHRILFPWWFRSKLYGVTGRSLDPLEPAKTLPLYGTPKGKLLYLPAREIDPTKPLILVEGELDAIRIYQDIQSNVAAFGFGTMTAEQAILIRNHASSVVCFFDDDHEGQLLNDYVHITLAGHVELNQVDWPSLREEIELGDREKLDPANMTAEELMLAIDSIDVNSDFPTL